MSLVIADSQMDMSCFWYSRMGLEFHVSVCRNSGTYSKVAERAAALRGIHPASRSSSAVQTKAMLLKVTGKRVSTFKTCA